MALVRAGAKAAMSALPSPVVTTATDLHSRFAVDVFAKKNGCAIFHMKAAKEASAALLAGEKIGFYSEFPWEGDLPDGLVLCGKDGIPSTTGTGQRNASAGEVPETGIPVTLHRSCLPFTNTVHVVPPAAVLGMGCRKGKDAASIQSAAIECLQEADLYKEALHSIASIDLKKEEPGLLSLAESWHLLFETFTEEELKAVKGEFTPSKFVKKITGVDNVCERSAVLASGQGTLIRKKTGYVLSKIYVVGIGPGAYDQMTGRAIRALNESDVIIGYTVYVDLVKEYFAGKEFMTTPMKKEVDRCVLAFEEAKKGKTVSMICSGDAGVYGMAGLMYEVGENYPDVELTIIPGVTAATGGAAVLGAPLIHDFCLISLSDLLTPWEKIEARLLAAAQADFVVCLYNPSSRKRKDYLQKACDLMMKYKSPDTVCGTVAQIARDGEHAQVMTLKELRDTEVDMFTTVFVGNSQTKNINGKMVTPRGYKNV